MIQRSTPTEVAAYSGCGTDILVNSDGCEIRSIEDAMEYSNSNKFELDEETDFYELEDLLQVIDDSWRVISVIKEDKLDNFFFTEKGLRKYYGDEVNTFLTGVNNPELETVMTFLCELSGGKLHV